MRQIFLMRCREPFRQLEWPMPTGVMGGARSHVLASWLAKGRNHHGMVDSNVTAT